MEFSEFSKELIKQINDKKIIDIVSFFQDFNEIKLVNYKGYPFILSYENIYLGKIEKFEVETNQKIFTCGANDFDTISSKFLEYIFLCEFLERNNLIRATKLSSNIKTFTPLIPNETILDLEVYYYEFFSEFTLYLKKNFEGIELKITELKHYFNSGLRELHSYISNEFGLPTCDEMNKIFHKYCKIIPNKFYTQMNQIIAERYNWEFYPSPLLSEFIKNGYRTQTEYNRDRETSRAYWIPLIVAISSILITSAVNYLIYTDKRDVNIINQKDTIKTLILSPSMTFDTTKIDSIKQ